MSTKILPYLLGALALSVLACNAGKNAAAKEKKQPTEVSSQTGTEIPFFQARNYFIVNSYPDSVLHSRVITTQEGFSNLFGMAATMGEQGRPTPIDFSSQYVIAGIGPASDVISSLEVLSLKQLNGEIWLTCRQKEGEKRSAITRLSFILVVDQAYQGELKLRKE